MRSSTTRRLVLAAAGALSLAACSSSRTGESTGEFVDDSVITSKVKTALLNDSGLKSFNIGVETFKEVVQLSGFVSSEDVKARAGQVAGSVSGVKSVRNSLIVK